MITVPLTKGYVAIVDDEDAWVLQWKWSPLARTEVRAVYAHRKVQKSKVITTLLLHRVILGVSNSETHVDHLNGDGLDNRRSNLRTVTRSDNLRNVHGPRSDGSSGYLGVSRDCNSGKWRAYIQNENRRVSLGYFHNIEDANAARLAAERTLWGVTPRRAWAHEEN